MVDTSLLRLAALAAVVLTIAGFCISVLLPQKQLLQGVVYLVWAMSASWVVTSTLALVYFGLLDFILPRVHFAIGQGERRYKNWTKW